MGDYCSSNYLSSWCFIFTSPDFVLQFIMSVFVCCKKAKHIHSFGGVGWRELKSLELDAGVKKRWGEGIKNMSLVLISHIMIELETAGG